MRRLVSSSLALTTHLVIGCSEDTETPTPEVGTGNSVLLVSYPPVVISTMPASGACGVSAELSEIEIVFSRAMDPNSYSWVTAPPHASPDVESATYIDA